MADGAGSEVMHCVGGGVCLDRNQVEKSESVTTTIDAKGKKNFLRIILYGMSISTLRF